MFVVVAAGALIANVAAAAITTPIVLSPTPPSNASEPVPTSFVSFSIEFSSFPQFAGNSSEPNYYSYQLLKNLNALQGTFPIIRVGGNTQDYATFNASQPQALLGSYDFSKSRDYPTTISIGPSYFDSYSTWPGVRYLHGFNLGKNGTIGFDTLIDEVPYVCEALAGHRLAYFQLGNEPDLYKTSAQGPVRPPSWNETSYVDEWLNKTEIIRQQIHTHCPSVLQSDQFKFYAPSFAGIGNSLNLITTWEAGLDTNSDIAFIDSHNYIGGATQPGVTLQGTLMNHTSTVISVNRHLNESNVLRAATGTRIPYILGETNSLYNEGAPGLSDAFGAALWGVDFNLYCAATGIQRTHMHQGVDYRYAAWSPIATTNTTLGTKAPYYGNIMVASMMGNLAAGKVQVADIELGDVQNTAYAAYVDGRLKRIAIIQMTEYNYTAPGASAATETLVRPNETFTFRLPQFATSSDDTLTAERGEGQVATAATGRKQITVQRLLANGSNAISGITFDGYSYNYELERGRPVLLTNVTRDECVSINDEDGTFSFEIPWSSAAILHIH